MCCLTSLWLWSHKRTHKPITTFAFSYTAFINHELCFTTTVYVWMTNEKANEKVNQHRTRSMFQKHWNVQYILHIIHFNNYTGGLSLFKYHSRVAHHSCKLVLFKSPNRGGRLRSYLIHTSIVSHVSLRVTCLKHGTYIVVQNLVVWIPIWVWSAEPSFWTHI